MAFIAEKAINIGNLKIVSHRHIGVIPRFHAPQYKSSLAS